MKLISWNVAGRVKNLPLQLEAISARNPDVIALQEVTPNAAHLWKVGLTEAGYEHILTSFDISPNPDKLVGARRRCLLIASRWQLEPLDQKDLDMPWKERLLSTMVHHPRQYFELHAAYIPPGSSHGWLKIETFEGIYRYLAHTSDIPRILCGDFNSPKKELIDGRTIVWGQRLKRDGTIETPGDPRWAQGERLVIRDLEAFDMQDIYRKLNGWDAEDYSWVLKRKGKVVSQRRFDHVFLSGDLGASSCQYLHEFRLGELSDHSAIEVVFSSGLDKESEKQLFGEKQPKKIPQSVSMQPSVSVVSDSKKEKPMMTNQRDDIRDLDPQESHRTAFLAGWTRAVQGDLFATVMEKKTHANMGNLFGWIYGEQSREFRLATWYHYLENTTN